MGMMDYNGIIVWGGQSYSVFHEEAQLQALETLRVMHPRRWGRRGMLVLPADEPFITDQLRLALQREGLFPKEGWFSESPPVIIHRVLFGAMSRLYFPTIPLDTAYPRAEQDMENERFVRLSARATRFFLGDMQSGPSWNTSSYL